MPTAKDLREGDLFTWKPGTFRGPAEFNGHIIVMMPYCKQLTLPPEHPVVIHSRMTA